MRRLSVLAAIGGLLTMLMSPASISRAQFSGATVNLTFLDPAGAPLSNGSVAVYREPFNPGASYTLTQLASGTANSSGQFSFSFSETDPEINALIAAADSTSRWMVYSGEILPTVGTTSLTFRANVDLSAVAPAATSLPPSELVKWRAGSCEAASDPDGGFDALLSETEPDPNGPNDTYQRGTYQTLDACLTSGGGTTSTASAVSEDSDGSVAHVDETRRWVKIVDHHSAKGMRTRFTFSYTTSIARDTRVQLAVKVGNDPWGAGAMYLEQANRTASRTKVVDGGYHRRRFAKYVFYKYEEYCCGDWVVLVTRKWKPHHWTGGLRRSKTALTQPARNSANSITLGVNDTFTKSAARNKQYGAGVSLVGLSLDSRTGYSTISKLGWTGITSGCSKWLYGATNDPVEANVVYAKSNC